MVDVAHDDDDRRAGDQVLRPVFAVVYELFLNGDNDFLLDLAAELHRHQRGGVVIYYVRKRGHYAVFYERLYDLRAGLLHPRGQLAHADGVRDLDLELSLFGYLELQLLHALALFGAALGAGRGLLLALLLAVLELLLAALFVFARVRAGEAVKALVIFAEVHVAAAARVYDALLGLLARDVGLLLLRLGLLLSGLLRRLGRLALRLGGLLRRRLGLLALLLCGAVLSCLRGLGLRFGYLEQLLHRRALVPLSKALEDQRKLRVLQDLHVVLRRGRILRQYLNDGLGGQAEILGHLVHPVLVKTTHGVPSPVCI